MLLEDSGDFFDEEVPERFSNRGGIAGPSPSKEALRLANIFDTDEKIGVEYDEEEGASYLPGRKLYFGHCTSVAAYVLSTLKKGEIWGVGDGVKAHANHGNGHDWSVIDRRYIVDPWNSTFTGETDQVVFDLQNPADAESIEYWFGDRKNWVRLNSDALGDYLGELGCTTDFLITGEDDNPFSS